MCVCASLCVCYVIFYISFLSNIDFLPGRLTDFYPFKAMHNVSCHPIFSKVIRRIIFKIWYYSENISAL